MKKHGVLNSQLARVIAGLGHSDKLVVCDSGLPIPRAAELIDLALTKNVPRFLETVKTILEEAQVERAIVAEEMETVSKATFDELSCMLDPVSIQKVSHEQFKELTRNGGNIAFVRTGEATPYANVILVAGVTFD
jgi:D-ribose pyranase